MQFNRNTLAYIADEAIIVARDHKAAKSRRERVHARERNDEQSGDFGWAERAFNFTIIKIAKERHLSKGEYLEMGRNVEEHEGRE